MKQINVNRIRNRSITNATRSLPFAKVYTEKGLEDLSSVLKAENGLTFDFSNLTFKLGGEITEDTTILIPEGVNFAIGGENNSSPMGLLLYDDNGLAIGLGAFAGTGALLNIYPDLMNIKSINELNIISENLNIKDGNNVSYVEYVNDEIIFGDKKIKTSNLPVFADDAAASSLDQNQWYRTATGELRIKL